MKRSQTLDILRSIAILLVLGRHMTVCPVDTSRLLYGLTSLWLRGGWIGVDIFFVLSGFLVSGLLFKEHLRYGSISISNFLVRRGLKIYPPFYSLILITIVVNWLTHRPIGRSSLLHELFFLQNYGPNLWLHTWSLAVEEHFYLLLPILLVAIFRFSGRQSWILLRLCVLIAVSCLGVRIWTSLMPGYEYLNNVLPTQSRIDSLLFGVLLSYYYHYKTAEFAGAALRYRRVLLLSGVAALMPAFVFRLETTTFMSTFGLTMLYLGAGMILVSLLAREIPSTVVARCFAFIGSRSYSIYLWHMPVNRWVSHLGRQLLPGYWNWYMYAAVYLAGSLIVGIVMAQLIEIPFLRLRDRLYPSRSRTPALDTEHQRTAEEIPASMAPDGFVIGPGLPNQPVC